MKASLRSLLSGRDAAIEAMHVVCNTYAQLVETVNVTTQPKLSY